MLEPATGFAGSGEVFVVTGDGDTCLFVVTEDNLCYIHQWRCLSMAAMAFFFDGIGKQFLIQPTSNFASTSIFFCWNLWTFLLEPMFFQRCKAIFDTTGKKFCFNQFLILLEPAIPKLQQPKLFFRAVTGHRGELRRPPRRGALQGRQGCSNGGRWEGRGGDLTQHGSEGGDPVGDRRETYGRR